MWLLRLMADRGLALLDASGLLMVIEERGELRVAAASGESRPRLRIVPIEGSALGALFREGKPVALDRPRGADAALLHELGIEARAVLVEPLSMEGQGGGLVIALRRDSGFKGPDREALSAFAASVSQRLTAERSVEIERLRYGMQARERERTRWAREIHDETIQGLGALRLKLANARDLDTDRRSAGESLSAAVDAVLDGLGEEIDGLRHLITELRPAALDDLGLAAALEALARRMQAIDGLDVQSEIDLGPEYEDRRLDAELEEHDLPGRPGGAHERQPPRPGHAGARQRERARRRRQSVRHRRRRGTARSRPARAARRRAGGRFWHVRHARARGARRRGAGARAGPGAGHGDAPVRATGGPPGAIAARGAAGERGGVDLRCLGQSGLSHLALRPGRIRIHLPMPSGHRHRTHYDQHNDERHRHQPRSDQEREVIAADQSGRG